MMKLTFLGTSASAPGRDSFPSCFCLKRGSLYLFDCCEGAQHQLMKFKCGYGNVSAIFISHLHADHFLGIPGLVQTLKLNGRTEELKIFGPKGTKKLVSALLSIKELEPGFPVKVEEKDCGPVLEENDLEFSCFPVKHNCPAIGFTAKERDIRKFDEKKAKGLGLKGPMFSEIQKKGFVLANGKRVKLDEVSIAQAGKKIVYTGDTVPLKSIAKIASGAELLIHDSCFLDSEREIAGEKMHSTALQAAETAVEAKAKKLVLTHFSNRHDNRKAFLEEAKKKFPETVLAHEGLELEIR